MSIQVVNGLLFPHAKTEVPSWQEFVELKGWLQWVHNRIFDGKEQDGVWIPSLLSEMTRVALVAGEQVALRSEHTGKYVTADANEGQRGRLRADWADQIDGWENFSFIDVGDGKIAIRANVNGKYVGISLDEDIKGCLVATMDRIENEWQKFHVEWQGPGYGMLALKSAGNDKYVGAAKKEDGGHLGAFAAKPQGCERFRWQIVGGYHERMTSIANAIAQPEFMIAIESRLDQKLHEMDGKLHEMRDLAERVEKTLEGNKGLR